MLLCFPVNSEMSPDELVYLGILAASIPVGVLFRYLSKSPLLGHVACFLISQQAEIVVFF